MRSQGYSVIHYPEQNSELIFLTAPLRHMFEIIDQYIDDYCCPGQPEERPFAWNERATLGLFAGGVWRESRGKNLVLEEYRDRKLRENGEESKGRTDIWFRVTGYSCFAEAKQDGPCWSQLGNFGPQQAKNIIQLLTKEAKDAYRNSKQYRDRNPLQHSLGIAFVTPYLRKEHLSKGFEYLNTFKSCLNDSLKVFTETEGYVVLRGSYFREDLLTEQAIYSTSWGQATLPGVEALFCEQRKE